MSLICGSIEMLRLVEGINDYLHAQVPLFMVERGTPVANIAGSGQLWVKNDTPNTLWFRNDAGTDVQLGSGISNVVEDTSPQLGGDLDAQTHAISGSGTIDMAPNARSVSATGNTATTDYSKVINLTGGSGQTFTLDGDPPTNAIIFIDNSSGNSWTLAASTSLIWAKDATTGNRTLADDGVAIAKHRGSGTWVISGSDLLT
jgi:hypothetical protein